MGPTCGPAVTGAIKARPGKPNRDQTFQIHFSGSRSAGMRSFFVTQSRSGVPAPTMSPQEAV